MLTGSDLFLVDSVAGDAQFSHPVQVPDGFPGSALPVPHPDGDGLYVKLRDDPSVVNQVTLTVQQLPPPKAQSASSHPPRRPNYVRPASADVASPSPSRSARFAYDAHLRLLHGHRRNRRARVGAYAKKLGSPSHGISAYHSRRDLFI